MRLLLPSLAAATLLLIACQALLSSDVNQCNTNEDCAALGAAFAGMACSERVCVSQQSAVEAGAPIDATATDPRWACLGHVVWGEESPTEKVRIRYRFTRIIGGAPVVGFHGKMCSSLDPACTTPFVEGDTDANGDITLQVPRNFPLFFESRAA